MEEDIRNNIKQIIEDFSGFDDWMDKYNLLIEMGKNIPLIPPQFKNKSNLISGCQSRVWLHAKYDNGRVYFFADSDAVITRGIISLLIKALDGKTPDEILSTDLDFIDTIGLKDHLSPTRSNGLISMIKQMKLYALAYKAKEQSEEKKS